MAFLNWSPAYSIGVAELDAEHEEFFALLNRLYDSIMNGSDTNEHTAAILEQVRLFAKTHCANEEELLAIARYPELANIKREHQQLYATLEKYSHLLNANGSISRELARFLLEWVLQHILRSDRKGGAYLKAAGVR